MKELFTIEFGHSTIWANNVEVYCEKEKVLDIAIAIYEGWATNEGRTGYCIVHGENYEHQICDCL